MDKYWVVERGDEYSRQLAMHFHDLAEQNGMAKDEEDAEIVLSIGGDGTMLQAFHQFKDRLDRVAFVGIHTGRLGFFADWKPEDVDPLALMMQSKTVENGLKIVEYPLVEIRVETKAGVTTELALNEFTLKGVEATLVAQLNINNEMFESFRGDGFCISTPTGSTGYNKSLGGGLIHPSLEAIQIAEIASINNRVYRTLGSSIILPKHHYCDIIPREGQALLLTLDHLHEQRADVLSLHCRVAEQKVRFARFRPFPFWNRVRDAFIGYEVK